MTTILWVLLGFTGACTIALVYLIWIIWALQNGYR